MALGKFRLVTRSDFDGLGCAVLLRERGLVDEVVFIHPKDLRDGKVAITGKDILANLPHSQAAHLVFDHHASEVARLSAYPPENHVIDPRAASAARVVYDHLGGSAAFGRVSPEMIDAVDKSDSARFTRDEVLDPTGWVLLGFVMDSRTGFGRFHGFRISNYRLMIELVDHCRERTVSEILELSDVVERTRMYTEHAALAREQILRCSTVHGRVVVLDLREEPTIYVTNRFTVYTLFPECNLSIHMLWGLKRQNTVLAIGKSIFNRTSPVDVSYLTLRHGGGCHVNAGTCPVPNDMADDVLAGLLQRVRSIETAEVPELSYR